MVPASPVVSSSGAGVLSGRRERHQLSRNAARQEPPAPGQGHVGSILAPHELDETAGDETHRSVVVERVLDLVETQRLVEPQAEQETLARACRAVDDLGL